MKPKFTIMLSAILLAGLTGCQTASEKEKTWVDNAIETATVQLKLMAGEAADTDLLPRSVYTGCTTDFLEAQLETDSSHFNVTPSPLPADSLGKMMLTGIYDWTSGFFPGCLWYGYELTGEEALKTKAIRYTSRLNPIRHYRDNHDIGFMVYCSYGNALRLAPADTIKDVLVETADNLCTRFDERIGCIRSWDFGEWNYPVIIDNMMNLELLFAATRLTGNPKYREIALCHARTTLRHHFRPDHTCYHVVSYNDDGTVESRGTFQGKAHDSAWARGQAWAVYGYTLCYRETKDSTFLQQAVSVADMLLKRVNTDDAIPYWDLDAPVGVSTPRDASAAAIMASALLELGTFVPDGQKYFDFAEKQLKSLSGKDYLAEPGTNHGFILMHSTGSLPHGSEIDTPLIYADYYYLEALKRYKELNK